MKSQNRYTRTLVVLGTGGTIAGRAQRCDDHTGYAAGQIGVQALLHGIPVPAGYHVEHEQVAQIDSKDMGPEVWKPLLARVQHHLQRPEVAGLVVTHGTDTLEETAYLLQRVLCPAKPVVLTCAMRPATALAPDGPQNLADALLVAAHPGAHGVVAVCTGRIHRADAVQKVHPYRLDAFSSGDAGPLGQVEQGRLTLWRTWPGAAEVADASSVSPWPSLQHWHGELLSRLLAAEGWPRVEVVVSHAGADGMLVWAMLAYAGPGVAPLRGLVVAGTGNGTLHQDLLVALQRAQTQGVVVWRTTRCAEGRVVQGDAPAQGGIPAVSLPLPQARLALQLALLHDAAPDTAKTTDRAAVPGSCQ